ncbi:transcriptional regulator [Chryseobacterium lathyri]|uniref:transcriptional regulator n=1 Tax=Chryseobacterium lathyri TaxID=395933 RepID=UPI002782EEE6|nr:tetratricopeptide repeat protein [Chryseobacterium lathyri]MDQ0067935.1 tetratricopeptide (TPR) repeat protein [Chryseobacterium lathyri]
MLKKILFLLFTISVSVHLLGQKYTPKEIDSLGKIAAFSMTNKKEALQLLFKYVDIAGESGYEKEEMYAMYRALTVYYDMAEYEKLIEYSLRLEDYAHKLGYPFFEMLAIRMRAISYMKLGVYNKSESLLKQALEKASKLKGDEMFAGKGSLFSDLVILKSEMRLSYDKSTLVYLKESLKWYNKMQDKDKKEISLIPMYSNIGMYFSEVHQLDSARYYSRKALRLSISRKDTVNVGFIFSNMGSYYYKSDEQDSALFYLKKALPITKLSARPYQLKDVYDNLALVYEKQKDYKNSLFYRNKYKSLADSLRNVEKMAVNKESIRDNETSKQQSGRFYIILGLILSVLLIMVYYAVRYFKRYRKERKEKKQKEVVISDLEDKMNDAFEEVVQLAKSDDPAFLLRFKEIYPEFYKKLSETYPFLTSGQLKFCALLRLNFSTKEIAHYNHLTIRGIETKKNRLRKQLDIPSHEDLNNWMMKF